MWKLVGWLVGWLVAIGVVIFACVFLSRTTPEEMRATEQAEMEQQLALVCQGTHSSAAASYSGLGPHPTGLQGSYEWQYEATSETWCPDNIGEAQLVVCVDKPQDIPLEVCKYIGPDITRYRSNLPVRILEARTGKLVAQHTFVGSEPRQCKFSENMSTTAIYGDSAAYSEVKAWLRQYIESSGASLQPKAKEINVYCGFQGSSPQYLQPDQPVSLYWRWGTTTEQYRQDYIDSVTFFLRLDGEGVDISTAARSLDACEEGDCA